VLKKTEHTRDEQPAEEYLPGTEGEGNGYVEGATMEGPGWESDDREEFGDLLQADKLATFFYQDGEHEGVEEEDIGIAGHVAAHYTEGGHKVARTPPSEGGGRWRCAKGTPPDNHVIDYIRQGDRTCV